MASGNALETHPTSVVNLHTGEVLEHLDKQPPEVLADAMQAVQERQRQLKEMCGALDDELRRRLEIRGRKTCTFGDFEVAVEGGWESQWDPDQLEIILQEFVNEDHVITAGETAGVIQTKREVSRSTANKLLGRLTDRYQERMKTARTWKPKRGKITITRSVKLVEPDAERRRKNELKFGPIG